MKVATPNLGGIIKIMAKLTSCKACEKEIAKGVKKCPNCGKDQRNWFMRHKFLTFIGVIIILAIIISATGGDSEDTADANDKAQSSVTDKEKTYKPGDVIKDGKLEVTVTKFEEKAKVGSQYVSKEASEGGTFVAIQYKMKNVSEEPVGMFSYPTLKLVDEKGTKYDSDLEASTNYSIETGIDDSKVLSDLNPDISVNDSKVYEISKEKLAKGNWYIEVGDAKVQIK